MIYKNEFGTQMKKLIRVRIHSDTDTHTGCTYAISEKYAVGTVFKFIPLHDKWNVSAAEQF